MLARADIQISMDGRGPLMDNVFIERLWRSLSTRMSISRVYGDGLEARTGIGQWIGFYNETRPHQAHAYRTRWRYGAKA